MRDKRGESVEERWDMRDSVEKKRERRVCNKK